MPLHTKHLSHYLHILYWILFFVFFTAYLTVEMNPTVFILGGIALWFLLTLLFVSKYLEVNEQYQSLKRELDERERRRPRITRHN